MSLRIQLPSGIRWSGMLAATVLCATAGAVVLLQHAVPLVFDLFRPSVSIDAVDITTPLLAQHETTQGMYESRFEGRSLFFAPQDWKRKIPPPPPPPPPSPPPPPPVAPTEYTGPKVVGMLGSTVYLEGARTLEIGKDAEGVTLVEIISPWMVKIRHKGKEYDVAVGQKVNDSNFKPLTSASTPSGVTVAPAAGTVGAAGAASAASPASAASAASGGTPPTLNSASAVPPIPPATSEGAVAKLGVDAARAALAEVAAARGRPDVNEATRQRLEAEEQWLVKRLEDLTR